MKERGLIHLYTGDGKGKTTASVGLCVRAAGAGLRVLFVQFMKGRDTAELASLRKLGVEVLRQEKPAKFVFQMDDAEKAAYRKVQQECFAEATGMAADFDVLVLDEVISAVTTGMLDARQVCDFLQSKPAPLEVVMTGRDAPQPIRDLADYVSCITAEKHPYEQGIAARKGIEY